MKRDSAENWARQPGFGRTLDVVLVPLDGSEATEAALQSGIAIAERAGAELHIAAAANADEATVYLGEGVEMVQPGSREFAALLEEYVDELADALSRRCTCRVQSGVITADDPREGLNEYERRVGVGLTVIGTRVPDTAEDSAWRSLSSDVARRASPLLFVPAAGPERAVPGAPVSRIAAVLLDDEVGAGEHVVRCSASYASLWGVPLLLLDAGSTHRSGGWPGLDRPDTTLDRTSWDLRRTRLERIAGLLRERGMSVDTRSLEGPERHAILASVAREERIDTIVMSHASTSVAEWLLFGRGASVPRTAPPDGVSVLVCPSRHAT